MTVSRRYACDLCGDELSPDRLIGWEFAAFHDDRHDLRRQGARAVEHHFCAPCLIGVSKFHDAVAASGVWPE